MEEKANEPAFLDSDVLKQIVDEVMQQSSRVDAELNNFSINAEDFLVGVEIDEDNKIIINDAVVTNDMFTDNWGRSLYSALTDITHASLPHFAVIQKCIVYILNAEALHFGIAKSLLTKLLFFHPPNTPAMESYYWHILSDEYVMLETESMENENIFFTVIKSLSACLDNPVLIKDKEKQLLGNRNYWSTERDSTTGLNYTVRLYYNHLPVAKQFDRALLVFEFLYEILQKNFVHHMKNNTVHTEGGRCLLSRIFWSQVIDVGTITQSLKKLLRLLVLMGIPSENHIGQYHKKFMVLLAEFYKHIDMDKNFNPFYKNKKCYLASELSLKLYKGLKNQFTTQGVKYLKMVRPHWLRLAVSCKWLGYITCKYCPAELSSVCEVLKLLRNLITKKRFYRGICGVRSRSRGRNARNDEVPEVTKPELRYCSLDCVFLKRNKSKKIKISPEEIKDPECFGWSALHKAILLGHQKCVETIVNFTGEPQPEEPFDTRIPGYKWFAPLLSALIKEQGKVCTLLMDHSGHGLFEDINMSSDTPFDVFDDRDIGRITNTSGPKRQPETWKQFHFTPTDIPLVTDVCMVLVESYFVTYRIPDVISRLKGYKPSSSDSDKKKDEETKESNADLEENNSTMDTNSGEKPKESNADLEENKSATATYSGEKPKLSKAELEEFNWALATYSGENPEESNADYEEYNWALATYSGENPEESNADLEENDSTIATYSCEETKEWEYDRYEKDLNKNLKILCEMMTKYADNNEIKKSLQPLHDFLHDVTEE